MDEKELFELAKKFGDEYTYGRIVKALKEVIKDSKKEVFDDIENSSVEVPLFHSDCNCEWCEIKKKHLRLPHNKGKK